MNDWMKVAILINFTRTWQPDDIPAAGGQKDV